MIFCFVSPTILAVAMDFVIRGRSIAGYSKLDLLNYFGSTMASAGFWGGPLWLISRGFLAQNGRRRIVMRVATTLFFALWVMPFATFCFGGQAVYHAVFHSYMA